MTLGVMNQGLQTFADRPEAALAGGAGGNPGSQKIGQSRPGI